MTVAALILAAGQGLRLGAELPKAQVRVAGRTLLRWSADALGCTSGVHAVLPVVGTDAAEAVAELLDSWVGPAELLEATRGGTSRQDSVRAGLAALLRLRPSAEWVLVHDAARCLVAPEDCAAVLDCASETGAAVLVAPVQDTLKQVDGKRIVATPDRSAMVCAQTPQVFRIALLRDALARAAADGFEGTDCSSLVERLDAEVRTCTAQHENFKVTTAADLQRADAMLGRRARALASAADPTAGGSAVGSRAGHS